MLNREELRKTLEARLAELTQRVQKIDGDLRQQKDADYEERAIETAGDEVLEGLEDVNLLEIAQIKAAFERLELGTFGTCAKCGEPIGERRLKAIPYASTCINCSG